MTKLVNCGNDFYPQKFEELCKELEAGEHVNVYIDCIGHTRNNWVQEVYKEKLEEKYGDKLVTHYNAPYHCYDYDYKLTT